MNKNLFLACLAGAILAVCGGKNESEPKTEMPASPAAAPASVAAPVTSALPKADASITLTHRFFGAPSLFALTKSWGLVGKFSLQNLGAFPEKRLFQ